MIGIKIWTQNKHKVFISDIWEKKSYKNFL